MSEVPLYSQSRNTRGFRHSQIEVDSSPLVAGGCNLDARAHNPFGVQGYLAHKKTPDPKNFGRAIRMSLL